MNLLTPKIEAINENKKIINWAIVLVLARCILLILFQGILAFYFHSTGNQTPWESAASWWTVYGTAVDLSCLLLLFFALKSEGKKIASLLDFDKKKIVNDLKNNNVVFFMAN